MDDRRCVADQSVLYGNSIEEDRILSASRNGEQEKKDTKSVQTETDMP